MEIKRELNQSEVFMNLGLLARQVVEGFISGIHKSPFHGFSSEFAEHKVYNKGESTKHIDWKLYARTDRLYTKKYDEETNLRCHFILDNSSSMHYPRLKHQSIHQLNKIGFGVLAIAALTEMLKKQRDAVGLSIYSNELEYYAPEKSNERHRQMLLSQLNGVVDSSKGQKHTHTYDYLHEIAEKLKRRSMVFLFSDMFQTEVEENQLFEALRHLKYNKHEVVLFHLLDAKTEIGFQYDNVPKRFIDVETGEKIDLYPQNVKGNYKDAVTEYLKALKSKCVQYKISYQYVDVNRGFNTVLNSFLIERGKFK